MKSKFGLFEDRNKVFSLDSRGIDDFSEQLDGFLEEAGTERQNRLRIRLSMEESLLRMRDRFGEEDTFEASFSIRFRRYAFQISHEGEIFNPLSKTESALEDWSGTLLTAVGLSPQYSYSGGKNHLRLSLPAARLNYVLKTLILLLISFVISMLILHLYPGSPGSQTLESLYIESFGLWNRILLCSSGPIIFFMLMTTILNTGSITEQGGNRRRSVLRYFLLSFLAAYLAAVSSWMLFSPPFQRVGFGWMHAREVLSFLFALVPEDVFSPLIQANTPQLLLIAFVFGNILVFLGTRARTLSNIIRQCNMAGLYLADWISRLVPYAAAILLCMELIRSDVGIFSGFFMTFLLADALAFAYMFGVFLLTGIRKKVSPRILWDKVKEPFLTALRTGSLDASFGQAEACCIRKLGIEKQFTVVSLPQGLVLYMPINVIGTLCFTVFAASWYNVEVTWFWFLTAIVLSVVLFVSTPPVPGANLIAYIVIFAQLKIPEQALLWAMLFDILFGALASACNQTVLQMELVLQADSIGLLDRKCLRRPAGG